MSDEYPFIKPGHLKSLLSDRYDKDQFGNSNGKRSKQYSYYRREEIIYHSGLTEEQLNMLGKARLLLPDYKDLYRPKLVSWAKKLRYLFDENWSIDEIYSWAKGRWSTPNPRKWPPDREYWIEKSNK